MLISQHTEVHAYDPTVSPNLSASDLTGIIVHQSAFDCIENADAILVATEWAEFKNLDAQQVGDRVRSKNIVDSRNILDEVQWRNQGFRFIGVGR
jgi:UDPglucose 6-dehydrogenase